MTTLDAILVAGGDIEDDFALGFIKHQKKRPFLAAADRGIGFFLRNGLFPDLVIGDFDSASPEMQEKLRFLEESSANIRIIRLCPEKDDTDTQAAVLALHEYGLVNIALLGVFGGRIDHLFANLALLVYMEEIGMHGLLADSGNRVRLIESGIPIPAEERFGTYVSFFAAGEPVEGLTLTGFKYPMRNRTLTFRDSGLTVSNEFTGGPAMVEYKSGRLLMIQSRDTPGHT